MRTSHPETRVVRSLLTLFRSRVRADEHHDHASDPFAVPRDQVSLSHLWYEDEIASASAR